MSVALDTLRRHRDDVAARIDDCEPEAIERLRGMWVAYTIAILLLERDELGASADCIHAVRNYDAEGYGVCMDCGQLVLGVQR